MPVSFATGSFPEIIAVAEGKYSLAWVNPSVMLTMAYRGKGPFKKRLPLKTIATFPSFDVMGFAVHESTGITSLEQIETATIPLRISTGVIYPKVRYRQCDHVHGVGDFGRGGFFLADIADGAARFIRAPRPSDPSRRTAIEKGTINAVFDEGIKSWGQTPSTTASAIYPSTAPCSNTLKALGYRLQCDVSVADFAACWRGTDRRFQRLADDRHAELPTKSPTRFAKPSNCASRRSPQIIIKKLRHGAAFANDDEAPYDVPLHPAPDASIANAVI